MEFFDPWYAVWQARGEHATDASGSSWPDYAYDNPATNSQSELMGVITELRQSLRGRVDEREQPVASSDSWWDANEWWGADTRWRSHGWSTSDWHAQCSRPKATSGVQGIVKGDCADPPPWQGWM